MHACNKVAQANRYEALLADMKHKAVVRFAKYLRKKDWDVHHLYFEYCLKHNQSFANALAEVMDCTELWYGYDKPVAPRTALPLPASMETWVRAVRPRHA